MKKMKTLYKRQFENHKIAKCLNEVEPECQWVLDGEGWATEKIDGTCCLIKNGKMLKKIETEIKLINDNIDKMYERLFNKLERDIKQKEEEYIGVKNEQENNLNDDIKNIEKLVNDFLKLEKPTPEIMKVLINRIEIHQDKQG